MFYFNFKIFKNIDFSPDDTYSAGNSLDEMRSVIDRDIAPLEGSIRVLIYCRNELCSISRLLFLKTEPKVLDQLQSITTLEINSSQRAGTLDQNTSYSPFPLVQERLIRSKTAKRIIRSGSSFDTSNPKAIEAVRSCLYEIIRVEELKLTANPRFLENIFWDIPNSAPQLNTMCIKRHFRSMKISSMTQNVSKY